MQQSSRNCFILVRRSFLTSLFRGSVATLVIVSDQLLIGNLLSPGLFSTLCAVVLTGIFLAPAGRPGPLETGAEEDIKVCAAEIAAVVVSGTVDVDTGGMVRANAASRVS